MPTRRQFLKGSLATAGAAIAGSAFLGSDHVTQRGHQGLRLGLQGVVFEPRIAASTRFAEEAGRLGLTAFAVEEDDITPTWIRVVDLWRATPAAIGGLTTLMPMMLLEQSARHHDMRFAFRAEHRAGRDGKLHHTFDGPAEAIDAFRLSMRLRRDFGACIAHAVQQCPVTVGGRTATSLRTPLDARKATVPLYSWVIARRHSNSRGALA